MGKMKKIKSDEITTLSEKETSTKVIKKSKNKSKSKKENLRMKSPKVSKNGREKSSELQGDGDKASNDVSKVMFHSLLQIV